MASYRLLDELPDTRKRKPPWSPLGLFFLTWLYLPVAAPFWIINWARLGHGERRLLSALAGAGAFALPFVLLMGLEMKPETVQTFYTVARFAFAYFQLFGQRPLYQAHLHRGGQKAATWPLWLATLVALAIQLAPFFVKK